MAMNKANAFLMDDHICPQTDLSDTPLSNTESGITISLFEVFWQGSLERMLSVAKSELFTFIVNGQSFESTVGEAFTFTKSS
jgi:hypothetical protein